MMVEKRCKWRVWTHCFLIVGILFSLFPIYFAFVASTHSVKDLLSAPIPLIPGHEFLHNYSVALLHGVNGSTPADMMLLNSFVMAFVIALGKIVVSVLSAFAIVYFRFPFRKIFFFLVFATLMLPVQVRIVPTFQVVASLGLLNTYAG